MTEGMYDFKVRFIEKIYNELKYVSFSKKTSERANTLFTLYERGNIEKADLLRELIWLGQETK